jgi:hypothetical protein
MIRLLSEQGLPGSGRKEEQRQEPRAAEQEEAPYAEEEQPETARVEGGRKRGLIDRAVDKARERGLVSG